MSGPPRPKCLQHRRNDCQDCRGRSKEIFGEEFHSAYFGGPSEYTSVRPAGRLLESDQDPSEGVPK